MRSRGRNWPTRDELFPGILCFRASLIGAHTFGAAREVIQSRLWQLAMGGDLTFYTKPSILDSPYRKNPLSFQVFLRVRPALSHHEHEPTWRDPQPLNGA
jgi:hypothetical protein